MTTKHFILNKDRSFEAEFKNMITIRPAGIDDIGELQRLNQEAFEDNVKYDPDLTMDWAMSDKGKEHFIKIFASQDSQCFVAVDSGVLVGYIVLSERFIDYRKSRCVEINDIGVTPAYQSKGIGSLLIQKAVEWAKERGYQKIYVNCYFANTRAVSFYRKNGLSEIDLGLETDL
jgi:GNAT superfamily N-acetyltransferase